MLKYVLLAGAVAISAPALAQTTAPAGQTAPSSAQTAPTTQPDQPQAVDQAQAEQAQQAATQDQAQTDSMTTATDPAAAPAQQAATEPAATGDQVAKIVDTEFPTYDKDSSGSLDKTEFGDWMVALRSASDPSVKGDSPEMKTWTGQAFASADSDKNAAVSKIELTTFLSKGTS